VTVNVAALAANDEYERAGVQSGRSSADPVGIRKAYIQAAEKILEDDLTTNLAIGRYGAEYLRRQQMPIDFPNEEVDERRYFTTSPPGTQGAPDRTYRKLSVLTHCNTGYADFIPKEMIEMLTHV
jgi:methylthioribose-1-phosphate isomerase